MSEAGAEPHAAALRRPARMTHVAVRTKHMDESVDFYRRYADLRVVHEREDDGIRVVWMSHEKDAPGFAIVLLEMPHEQAVEPAATDHFGFDVSSRDEVDAIGALAKREGRLKYGPADAGPVAGYLVLVRDPSGNTCEFSHGQRL